MTSYKRIVIDSGGQVYPDPPELKHIMKGLDNLAHNPAARIANNARKAYSLEALTLVGIKGVELMIKNKGWSEYKSALYRAVILTLFFGRLRSAEALGKKTDEYDLLSNLLMSDVVFTKDPQTKKITHATLHLREAKFQEETGALGKQKTKTNPRVKLTQVYNCSGDPGHQKEGVLPSQSAQEVHQAEKDKNQRHGAAAVPDGVPVEEGFLQTRQNSTRSTDPREIQEGHQRSGETNHHCLPEPEARVPIPRDPQPQSRNLHRAAAGHQPARQHQVNKPKE